MPTHCRLTRRQLLRLSAGSLLAAGLWPGALRAEEKDAVGAFHFLVANDIHYLNDKGRPWLEGVVKQMKTQAEKPEFCLIVGDLAENGKPSELRPPRDIFLELGMPVYQVIGNHDYQGLEDRTAYEELYPQRLNYRFEHRGWQFLGLDSSDGTKAVGVAVQPATLKWLDEHVPKLDATKPTVIFTHFPFGPLTPARATNANDVLARFKEVNLQAVFNGHYHGFTERKLGVITFTTNKCCSCERKNHDYTKEKGYFLCQAKAGKISRTFVEAPAT